MCFEDDPDARSYHSRNFFINRTEKDILRLDWLVGCSSVCPNIMEKVILDSELDMSDFQAYQETPSAMENWC